MCSSLIAASLFRSYPIGLLIEIIMALTNIWLERSFVTMPDQAICWNERLVYRNILASNFSASPSSFTGSFYDQSSNVRVTVTFDVSDVADNQLWPNSISNITETPGRVAGGGGWLMRTCWCCTPYRHKAEARTR